MGPEGVFRKRATKYLDSLPNTEHMSIQQLAIRGCSDKLLCIRGLFVWIEFKAEAGRESKLQTYYRKRFQRNAGAIAFVANPDNWKAIFEELKSLAEKGVRIGKQEATLD